MPQSETEQVLCPGHVKVGDGVTERVGSDRYAGTVTHVSPSGKTIRFTHDETKAAPGSNYYGHQEYEYSSVEEFTVEVAPGFTNSNVRTARWSEKRQRFVPTGGLAGLIAGRHQYSDPSF